MFSVFPQVIMCDSPTECVPLRSKVPAPGAPGGQSSPITPPESPRTPAVQSFPITPAESCEMSNMASHKSPDTDKEQGYTCCRTLFESGISRGASVSRQLFSDSTTVTTVRVLVF